MAQPDLWRVIAVVLLIGALLILRHFILRHSGALRAKIHSDGTGVAVTQNIALGGIGRAAVIEVAGRRVLVVGGPKGGPALLDLGALPAPPVGQEGGVA